MLVAVLASMFQADAPFPTSSPSAVTKGLRELGHRFVPGDAASVSNDVSLGYRSIRDGPREIVGTLSRNGVRFFARMRVGGTGKEGDQPERVWDMRLSIELAFPGELPTVLNEGGPRPDLLDWRTVIGSHLGKTATLYSMLSFVEGSSLVVPSCHKVRSDLELLWSNGARFAAHHGGRFVAARETDWSRVHLSDALVLRRADEVSLRRAASSWGWRPSLPAVRNSETPTFFHVSVADTFLTLSIASEESFPLTKVYVGDTVTLPPTIDAARWTAITGDDLARAERLPSGSIRLWVGRRLDLRQGVSLGDLRHRIEEIAGRLALVRRLSG